MGLLNPDRRAVVDSRELRKLGFSGRSNPDWGGTVLYGVTCGCSYIKLEVDKDNEVRKMKYCVMSNTGHYIIDSIKDPNMNDIMMTYSAVRKDR